MATEQSEITEVATTGASDEASLTAAELEQCHGRKPQTDIEEASVAASAGHGLLHRQPEHGDEPSVIVTGVPTSLALRLYVSHFLSTWNSRVFEFGAALFLACIFPGTLLPVSIYSLVRNAGYIIFSQPVGTWIQTGNRLDVIRASIVGQRVPVAASSALFLVLLLNPGPSGPGKDHVIFPVIVFLAVVERLCSTMNKISVERDWVVVITEGNEVARRSMNARMRRIDLACKLLGPLAISLVSMASVEVAIWTTLGMNLGSVILEYVAIAQVYKRVSGLQRNAETLPTPTSNDAGMDEASQLVGHAAVGYTSQSVGVARVGSSLFEISATWVAPYLTRKIGVVRAGIWSLAWQMACLSGALWWYFSGPGNMGLGSIVSATGLAIGVALSRMGLWGFDLCAQNIIQDEVEDQHRGTFSAVEASFQNLFEMLSYITTIVFPRPDEFQWPFVISVGAVYTAGGMYAYFLSQRRGHLLHAPPCIRHKE
ncbi:hypothetical protein VMCG_06005 [Cytospora schulzeri]|uniref:Solute carrier family 40 member n=1 Tax=Cytospora schulzeri TaxID=448051 RepID=A0A423WGN1_9PEZI|nr:hypothetical protein VMCG_06005 [Valsa malicola]